MKHIYKFLIIIIVAIITFFMQGCATKITPVDDVKVSIQLPPKTLPLVLNEISFYTIIQQGDTYSCIYSKDIDKFSLNEIKRTKYIEQLINENKALRKLLK